MQEIVLHHVAVSIPNGLILNLLDKFSLFFLFLYEHAIYVSTEIVF